MGGAEGEQPETRRPRVSTRGALEWRGLQEGSPSRNCRCRRASPATAPLAWKSPSPLALWSPARPLVATPDQNQPVGEGPCPPLGSPLQGKGELLGAQPRGAHLVRLEEPGFGSTTLPPHKDASSKTVFLCFGGVQVYALSGRGSGNAR